MRMLRTVEEPLPAWCGGHRMARTRIGSPPRMRSDSIGSGVTA
jgi:hypothetical protein